jgi:hypothetical protein
LKSAEGTVSGIEATYLWLMEELWQRNHGFAKEMVHLCDGQEALWDARQEYLPQRNTVNILDRMALSCRNSFPPCCLRHSVYRSL